MSASILTIVLARAENGVIGKDGAMPWHLPADLKRFKALTMGKPMIMGRKTFESLPGILPGRRHIVVTRNSDWRAEQAEVVHDVKGALALLEGGPASVIGGAEIVSLFEPHCAFWELTEVHANSEGDTEIAYPDPARWREIDRDEHAGSEGHPAYAFVTFERV